MGCANPSNFTSSTTLQGVHILQGTFSTSAVDGEPPVLQLIPMHNARVLPADFDTRNPHADMDKPRPLTRDAFRHSWPRTAPALQRALDLLRDDIMRFDARRRYCSAIGKGAWCDLTEACTQNVNLGSSPHVYDGPCDLSEEAKPELPRAELALAQMERFMILKQDCRSMRRSIVQLSPTLESERFSRRFQGTLLNCTVMKEQEQLCQQLNCYDGVRYDDLNDAISEGLDALRSEAYFPETIFTEANASPITTERRLSPSIGWLSLALQRSMRRRLIKRVDDFL